MSHYRRYYVAGGTYFLTIKLDNPRSKLLVEQVDLLRESYAYIQKKYPFETIAICVLPNHIHAIWTLPHDDSNYSLRVRLLKTRFSSYFNAMPNLSHSKLRRHEKGIWQRRFFEHTICDERDLENCIHYIYFNPVKHGWVTQVKDWQFSSFHRDVKRGWLPENWGGTSKTHIMTLANKNACVAVPHTLHENTI